ncbi:hypothetical protein BT69DRAFT_1306292 [Atractiella rhizophila]|nr:hypothetical protein BT69DRAFT_1306292 [Atractiella rhizophila]
MTSHQQEKGGGIVFKLACSFLLGLEWHGDVLSFPGCAVGVEWVFLVARDTIGIRRHRLKPSTIHILILAKAKLRLDQNPGRKRLLRKLKELQLKEDSKKQARLEKFKDCGVLLTS